MRWTTAQMDTIRELGHLGADAVRDEIERRYGVSHTTHAVEMMAFRIHTPLKVQQVCPDCGVVGLRVNRQTGLCPRCTERLHLEEATAFNDLLIEERLEAEGTMTDEMRRGYDAMRQRNSRLCRKHGLKTLSERRREGKATV